MFEIHGEDPAGVSHRCPGDGKCDRWTNAAGTYEHKAEFVCRGCDKDCSPPLSQDDVEELNASDEITDIADEIEDIVRWERAGSATDWSSYPFHYQRLVVEWRDAEHDVERIRSLRMQMFIKGFFKSSTDT